VVAVAETCRDGKILANIVITTSTGVNGYLPMRNERKNRTIGSTIRIVFTDQVLVFLFTDNFLFRLFKEDMF